MNLEEFIIKGKANGWVGSQKGGRKIGSTRKGSFDVTFDEGDYHYHDSFVGLSDFCGQEHITYKDEPVWSMVYYGYLLKPDFFTGEQTVEILQTALSKMYAENRFLGGFLYKQDKCEYRDVSVGDYKRFNGTEKIYSGDELVYELTYFGGMVQK